MVWALATGRVKSIFALSKKKPVQVSLRYDCNITGMRWTQLPNKSSDQISLSKNIQTCPPNCAHRRYLTPDFPRAKYRRQIFMTRAEVWAKNWAKFSAHFRASFAVQNDPQIFSQNSSQFITPCLVAENLKFHLHELLGFGGRKISDICSTFSRDFSDLVSHLVIGLPIQVGLCTVSGCACRKHGHSL